MSWDIFATPRFILIGCLGLLVGCNVLYPQEASQEQGTQCFDDEGTGYEDGEVVTTATCKTCTCIDGEIECDDLPCEGVCVDDDGEAYAPGEYLPSDDPCSDCICDGAAKIACIYNDTCDSEGYCVGDNGVAYENGHSRTTADCETCKCEDGHWSCNLEPGCEEEPVCVDDDGVSYQVGQRVPAEEELCEVCECEADGDILCYYDEECDYAGCVDDDGEYYPDGAHVDVSDCESCACINGEWSYCEVTDESCTEGQDCYGWEDDKWYAVGEYVFTTVMCSACECTAEGTVCGPAITDDDCWDYICADDDGNLYEDGEHAKVNDCESCHCINGDWHYCESDEGCEDDD